MRVLFLSILSVLLVNIGFAQNWQIEGERLTYRVKWGVLTAGYAELLYKPEAETYMLAARAWTTLPMFSLRERLKTVGEKEGFMPTLYTQTQAENDYRADKAVQFAAADEKKVIFANVKDGWQEELETAEGVRDILSTFYVLREQLEGFDGIPAQPVVNLDRVGTLSLAVGEPQNMRIGHKKYKVRAVYPTFHLKKGEDVQKSQNWVIWMTDDAERVPLKIRYTSSFGGFTAYLETMGTAASESKAPDDLPLDGPLPE